MLKNALFLIFLFVNLSVFAQFSVSGKVVSSETKTPIAYAEVYILDLGKSKVSDEAGNFEFSDIPAGTYEFAVFNLEYEVLKKQFTISENTTINFELEMLGEQLSEVLITKRKEEIFALRNLKQVEGTAIYAGKKSEVVVMDNLTTNTPTMRARFMRRL